MKFMTTLFRPKTILTNLFKENFVRDFEMDFFLSTLSTTNSVINSLDAYQ